MVCENPYEFGNGLQVNRKRDFQNRVMTAHGPRPGDAGRLDMFSQGGAGTTSLPRIGMNQTRSGLTTSQGQRYQTVNSTSGNPGGKSGHIIRQAEALDENRIVLYKKSKQLGQGYYIVEISSNNTHLFIAAYDLESPESLLIELPEKRAQDILNEFMNDYEAMANSLQVMNKRLVLLNPVSTQIDLLNFNLEIHQQPKAYEWTSGSA